MFYTLCITLKTCVITNVTHILGGNYLVYYIAPSRGWTLFSAISVL